MPLDKDGNPVLYKPWPNTTKSRYKYYVYVNKDNKIRKIGFGDKTMQQFKDTLGYWKYLDHGDSTRRKAYLARAKGIQNKQGEFTWKDKNSANWWSVHKLW
tara:strand:+ start:649 stop:951 length:303 start_codon:yes stop_codon:yes gene_type:complete